MNELEYLILSSALTDSECLQHLALEFALPHAEVAIATNRLFQRGDILARVLNPSEDELTRIIHVVLTMSEIQAHLDGKFSCCYCLTPQGGSRWEAVTHADWNRYFLSKGSQIICTDRELIEQLLEASPYIHDNIPIPGTEIWDVLEPWEVTYWKTLPKAYRVRYQTRPLDWQITDNTPQELKENIEQVCKWYQEIEQWYVEPELDRAPPVSIDYEALNYYALLTKIAIEKAEYSLLTSAILTEVDLRLMAYTCELSHRETAKAADALFQKGYILAVIFDNKYRNYSMRDVILTKTGVQDCLNGQLEVNYYLTPSGGAYWESIAYPNWDKFLKLDSLENPREGKVIGARREIIEELLALNLLRGLYKQIPGTEVWKVMEPWEATYWKTLPKGYEVVYQTQQNQLVLDLLHKEESVPAEFVKRDQEATQLYHNMRKWYSDPQFD